MNDVVLVEAGAVVDESRRGPRASGEGAGGGSSSVVWWRRHRWWLASAVVVLVLAVVSLAHAARERVELARISGVPGIVGALDGPVRERWSMGRPVEVLGEVGGVLVGTWWDDRGVLVARGIDAGTGHEAWAVPVSVTRSWGARCVLAAGPVDGPDRAVLACLVVDEAVPASSEGASVQASRAHLATLDPQTGSVLATYPAGPLDTICGLGTDIAIGSRDGAAGTVRRLDPHSGATVWTAVHPDPTTGSGPATDVEESGGVLVVQGGGQVWEVSPSGVELRSWTGLRTDVGWSLARTTGGHVLRTTYDQTSADGLVTDLGTGATVPLDSQSSVAPGVDDGSVPDLLLVAGPALVAHDLRAGRESWRLDHWVDALLVLDGTVYTEGAGTVQALDARTGAPRWSVPVGGAGPGRLATDGRTLLALERTPAGDVSNLQSIDLATGSSIWTARLPHAFDSLEVLAGRLAAVTPAGEVWVLG